MQPLSDQIHVVTCAGTEANGFHAVRYAPITHEQFKADIGRYRLPPPKGWAVLNGTLNELAHDDSNFNKSLMGYIPKHADGTAEYLKAAVDDLIHDNLLPTFRHLYEVDVMQYPAGYEAVVNYTGAMTYATLELLDLCYVPTDIKINGLHKLLIRHTAKGKLAYEALVRVYG